MFKPSQIIHSVVWCISGQQWRPWSIGCPTCPRTLKQAEGLLTDVTVSFNLSAYFVSSDFVFHFQTVSILSQGSIFCVSVGIQVVGVILKLNRELLRRPFLAQPLRYEQR